MKTKTFFACDLLLISLGCFLLTTTSNYGMFGEGGEDEAGKKPVDVSRSGDARLSSGDEAGVRSGISAFLSEDERVSGVLANMEPGDIQEIVDRLQAYQESRAADGNTPTTQEEITAFILQASIEIDARKAAALQYIEKSHIAASATLEATELSPSSIHAQSAQPVESPVQFDIQAHKDEAKAVYQKEKDILKKTSELLDRDANAAVFVAENQFKRCLAEVAIRAIRNEATIDALRLEEMHVSYLEALDKSDLTQEEKKIKYDKFKQALKNADTKIWEAVGGERKAIVNSKEINNENAALNAERRSDAHEAIKAALQNLSEMTTFETPNEGLFSKNFNESSFKRQQHLEVQCLSKIVEAAKEKIKPHKAALAQANERVQSVTNSLNKVQKDIAEIRERKPIISTINAGFTKTSRRLQDLMSDRDRMIIEQRSREAVRQPLLDKVNECESFIKLRETKLQQAKARTEPVVRSSPIPVAIAIPVLAVVTPEKAAPAPTSASGSAEKAVSLGSRSGSDDKTDATKSRSSLGSTSSESSGGSSLQSTPEKGTSLALEHLSEAARAEVEHWKNRVSTARKEAWEAVTAAEKEVITRHLCVRTCPIAESVLALEQAWNHYFNIIHSKISITNNLFHTYKERINDKNSFHFSIESEYITPYIVERLKNAYERYYISSQDDYDKSPDIQEIDQRLTKELQERNQGVDRQLFEAKLALVAEEENPLVLKQIEECRVEDMPGFPLKVRDLAMKNVRIKHKRAANQIELDRKYGPDPVPSSGSSSGTYNSRPSYSNSLQAAIQRNIDAQQQKADAWLYGMQKR